MILEEIKMVEDTPDDLVHELFTQHFWEGHPLGRPILGYQGNGGLAHPDDPARVFPAAYVAPNLIVSAAGNVEHAQVRELVARDLRHAAGDAPRRSTTARRGCVPQVAGPRPRSSSRATSASAPAATRRTTPIATSATS